MRTLSFVTLLVAVSVSPAVRAAVPSSFSVQGVLRNGQGALQTMNISVVANFYDAQTAGNLLAGPYTKAGIMAVNGLFTVTFSDPAIIGALSKTQSGQVWLELTVGNDLFPRQQVTPGIYSLMAAQADNATNATHAATADTATNATNATNAATASALSCTGCVTPSMIKPGSLSPQLSVSTQTVGSKTSVSVPTGNHDWACASCSSGVLVSGNCWWDSRGQGLAIQQSDNEGAWCCAFNNESGNTHTGYASANCLTISNLP
jgi:hypothetical protein